MPKRPKSDSDSEEFEAQEFESEQEEIKTSSKSRRTRANPSNDSPEPSEAPLSDIEHQLEHFWSKQQREAQSTILHSKSTDLPVTRVKKVMKLDEQLEDLMISSEVPVMFAKACEIFIQEMMLRAYNHASNAKRKTVRKEDLSAACGDSDMYDFLIDIVPSSMPTRRTRIASTQEPDDDIPEHLREGLKQLRPDNPEMAPYFEQVRQMFGMTPQEYIDAFKTFIKQPDVQNTSHEQMQTKFATHLANLKKDKQ